MKIIKIVMISSFLLGAIGCGNNETSDANKEMMDTKSKETFTEIGDVFKDYATNLEKWKKLKTFFGANPSIAPELSTTHGTNKLFRTVYKTPKNAKIGIDGYPNGTIFLKELRRDNNGTLGDLAGSTTVMIKEEGLWKFIRFTPDFKTIEIMGTQDGNNEIGNVGKCIFCHSQAPENDDFTFYENL